MTDGAVSDDAVVDGPGADGAVMVDGAALVTVDRKTLVVDRRWDWWMVRLGSSGWSNRFLLRPIAVTVVAVAATFVVLVVSLSIGKPRITPWEVTQLLAGYGDPELRPVLFRFRLARGLGGVYAGAALGMAGVLFQRLTHNPLATPDFTGVTGGATTAAAYALLIAGWHGQRVTLAALAGGFGAALIVYLLALHKGGASGYRMVLIGVGMTFLFGSVTTYLISQGTLIASQRTLTFLIGSLAGTSWAEADTIRNALIVVAPVAIVVGRSLRTIEMGDDMAAALGVRRGPVQVTLLACGVTLAAVTAAAVGPVAFVALMAAQLARYLAGSRALTLLPAAALGALLVTASDLIAREVVPHQLPVGVITAVIGAPFMLFMLLRTNRIGSLG